MNLACYRFVAPFRPTLDRFGELIYYALCVDPDMEIRNHLNQPRELVKGKVVMDLWA